MGAPLILDDEVVGALALWRNEVSPFDEREMAIVTAFAGQAAMAINGVKLVQELQARRAELARKVDELEALREVGEAVSSSLDLDRVLATIAMHAVELSGTDGGSIMEYDEPERRFLVRSVYRTPPEVVAAAAGGAHRHRRHAGRPRREGTPADRGLRPRARSTSTRTCRSSSTTGGGPWWPCRCSARSGSSGPSSSGAR